MDTDLQARSRDICDHYGVSLELTGDLATGYIAVLSPQPESRIVLAASSRQKREADPGPTVNVSVI